MSNAGVAFIRRITDPRSVNLTALLRRLISTCRKREGSVRTNSGAFGRSTRSARPFSKALGPTISLTSSMSRAEIAGRDLEFATACFQLRHNQHVVDETEKMFSAPIDNVEIVALLFRSAAVPKEIGETQDRV